jgi:hypothetical protein
MPEIKLHVTDADLARLNAEAAAAGVPRAQLIRERALSTSGGVARLTTAEYHALVAGAAAYMRGDLPRLQVETLCAYVITQLTRRATAA